ncbi:DUF4266 domain-containing protein [Chryseobacterium profundimaris]|uniref:DUF4266 domain-containing protein n=1 Tax=Chryseobacterium profundimaris TaxID=1387275 RepID=A0ABY1P371_9FLAO|nr:protein of unknown function [Chryseobacterium profundimaris]
MKNLIKNSQKLVEYLFGQLKTSFVNFEKTFVFASFMSSTPAFLLVPHKKSSVQAGLRRFSALNYRTVAVLSILTTSFLNSCTTVKEYEKNKLNDAEMVLGNRTIEKTELSFQSYREGSSGANAGKVGGGCGCN